jgi:hypothetical protein
MCFLYCETLPFFSHFPIFSLRDITWNNRCGNYGERKFKKKLHYLLSLKTGLRKGKSWVAVTIYREIHSLHPKSDIIFSNKVE